MTTEPRNGRHCSWRALGKTAISLPALGFGAGAFNYRIRQFSTAEPKKALAHAWNLGVRYFDTAPLYAYGVSERLLGEELRKHTEPHFVSTKVGRLLTVDAPPEDGEPSVPDNPFGIAYDYSRSGAVKSIEASFSRMGIDRVSVALIHDPDLVVSTGSKDRSFLRQAIREAYPALVDLKKAGLIEAIGLGVNDWKICATALDEASFDCFLIAGQYSLLNTRIAEEFFPICRKKQISIIVGGPFNSGILAHGSETASTYNYLEVPRHIRERVRALETICADFSIPLPAAALQFPLGEPCVASVIPGMRTANEVEQNVAHMNTHIPPSFWAALKSQQLLPSNLSCDYD